MCPLSSPNSETGVCTILTSLRNTALCGGIVSFMPVIPRVGEENVTVVHIPLTSQRRESHRCTSFLAPREAPRWVYHSHHPERHHGGYVHTVHTQRGTTVGMYTLLHTQRGTTVGITHPYTPERYPRWVLLTFTHPRGTPVGIFSSFTHPRGTPVGIFSLLTHPRGTRWVYTTPSSPERHPGGYIPLFLLPWEATLAGIHHCFSP